jgi:hypothetical protein
MKIIFTIKEIAVWLSILLAVLMLKFGGDITLEWHIILIPMFLPIVLPYLIMVSFALFSFKKQMEEPMQSEITEQWNKLYTEISGLKEFMDYRSKMSLGIIYYNDLMSVKNKIFKIIHNK